MNGAPAKLWTLTCHGGCEDFLRTQAPDLWAATISEIPETPDETKAREDYEKRGAKDRDYVQALALARIAGVEIPETLSRVLSGVQPHVAAMTSGLADCPAGHKNVASARFCNECGSPMQEAKALPAPRGAGEPVQDAAPPPVPAAAELPEGDGEPADDGLAGLHVAKLKKFARERGLDDSGTKRDVLRRLQKAS